MMRPDRSVWLSAMVLLGACDSKAPAPKSAGESKTTASAAETPEVPARGAAPAPDEDAPPKSADEAAVKSKPEESKPENAKPEEPKPAASTVKPPVYATVAAGGHHTCALVRRTGETRNRVKCWGRNEDSQLGLGDRRPRGISGKKMGDALPFVPLDESTSFIAVGAAGARTCALQEGGTLWCWGDNSSGELGLGDTEPRGHSKKVALQPVDLPEAVVSFALGSMHTCVRLADDSVRCWGLGIDGQLGSGDKQTRGGAPGQMGAALPSVDLGSGFVGQRVYAGDFHTCVLAADHRVKCFGGGRRGVLGLGDDRPRGFEPGHLGDALPVVPFDPDFIPASLASGSMHMCALSTEGNVECWGSNVVGQLGQGNITTPTTASGHVRVDLGSAGEVVDLVASGAGTCALIDVGGGELGAKCWGANQGGQLGISPANNVGDDAAEMGNALPLIELGKDVRLIALTMGIFHSCALVVERATDGAGPPPSSGRVKCWGLDEEGATGIRHEHSIDSPERMGEGLVYVDLGTGLEVPLPG